jgi:hypothetical protein
MRVTEPTERVVETRAGQLLTLLGHRVPEVRSCVSDLF